MVTRSNRRQKDDREPTEDEAKESAEHVPTFDPAPKEEKEIEMPLQLVQNFYVQGVLRFKDEVITFPKSEALKRLNSTNGVWALPS